MSALHMSVKVKVGSSWLHCASCFTFSLRSIKCSKTRPGSKYLYKVNSVCLILFGGRDGSLAKMFPSEKCTKFFCSKSKLSAARCNIIELRNAKDKQNDPFSKITFFICLHFCNDEQARDMNRNIINEVILLQFCSWFFFTSITLLHFSGEKVQSTMKAIFPSTNDKSKAQTEVIIRCSLWCHPV